MQSTQPQTRQKICGAKNSSRRLTELANGMDHNLQVFLAIGVSAALCLVTWIAARRGGTGVSHGKDR
jgi:hypothetical protein